MPEAETAEFWTAEDDGYSRETTETTWTDDYGNEHVEGCDGTEECDACEGTSRNGREPCRECDGQGTVDCTGCA